MSGEGAIAGLPVANASEPALRFDDTMPSGQSVSVLGMRIDELDYPRTLAQIRRWAENGESRYICVSTVHMVMEAHDDREFQSIVNGADLVGSDGVPVIWSCRGLGLTQKRVFAPDLTEYACAMAEKLGIPVGFYGSTPQVIEDLKRNMQTRYPRLNIAYTCSPPFRSLSEDEMDRIADEINDAGARILFVGLGCPKQERWMRRARPRVRAVMIGVGWAFDVCSGNSRAAPAWIQQIGMEWFYRLIENPKKLWKRHLKNNPRFMFYILLQLLGIRRYEVDQAARGR